MDCFRSSAMSKPDISNRVSFCISFAVPCFFVCSPAGSTGCRIFHSN
eukprot:UN04235